MKAILISIQPQHTCNILNDIKWWEIRKKFPKDYVGWVYIYCTKDKKYKNLINRGGFLTGMVVARFWCDKVEEIYNDSDEYYECYYQTSTLAMEDLCEQSCLNYYELNDYLCEEQGYAIHITKLEIFDKPKEISEFYGTKQYFVSCGNAIDNTPRYRQLHRAPQSWCYIEV